MNNTLTAPSGELRKKRPSSEAKVREMKTSVSWRAASRFASILEAASAILLVADARVEPGVAQVDQQVRDREDDAVEQDEVLDHRPVALVQRLHERLPEAGHAERALDRDRSAEQAPEGQARQRHDRQE